MYQLNINVCLTAVQMVIKGLDGMVVGIGKKKDEFMAMTVK